MTKVSNLVIIVKNWILQKNVELTDNLLSRGNAETVYAWNPIDIMNVYALWLLNMPTDFILLKRSKSSIEDFDISHSQLWSRNLSLILVKTWSSDYALFG